jgi:branched-subunit amino acid aminotransferase/4-amino-4-deoxychorismate lyase
MTEPLACLNGDFVPFSDCRLHVSDMGIIQAATVTDMLRTFDGRVFQRDAHLDRFRRSLKSVGFEIPEACGNVADVIGRLVEHNFPLLPDGHDLGIVLFATAGPNSVYLGVPLPSTPADPTVCVHTMPLSFERWSEQYRTGARLAVPSIRHIPPEIIDPHIKYRSRLHWFQADREAKTIDPQATALLLDHQGFVTETNGANFLVARDDVLLLPGERTTLEGVSRAYLTGLADRLGIAWWFTDVTPADVLAADEAFLVSTPFCIVPVTALDHQPIGDGRPGPLFARLVGEWSRQVNVDIIAQAQCAAAERTA